MLVRVRERGPDVAPLDMLSTESGHGRMRGLVRFAIGT